jgi:hypothetical protein
VRWERRGWLYPPTNGTWHTSHAALPFATPLNRFRFQVFFSGQDASNRSWVRSGVVNVEGEAFWESVEDLPVLEPGHEASFDGSGVSVGCVFQNLGARELWYHGWSLGKEIPWWNSVGMAYEDSNGRFVRKNNAPTFDRSGEDPWGHAYPFLVTVGTEIELWYSSYQRWARVGDEPPMEFVIKRARFVDGEWQRIGVALAPVAPDFAVSRPSVIAEDGLLKVWYATRGTHYRIAYAESVNGYEWERKEELGGLLPLGTGGECAETTYPHVVNAWGSRWIFYNGDGYGESGFGVAEWRFDD